MSTRQYYITWTTPGVEQLVLKSNEIIEYALPLYTFYCRVDPLLLASMLYKRSERGVIQRNNPVKRRGRC
jgi:hypothetical protein